MKIYLCLFIDYVKQSNNNTAYIYFVRNPKHTISPKFISNSIFRTTFYQISSSFEREFYDKFLIFQLFATFDITREKLQVSGENQRGNLLML